VRECNERLTGIYHSFGFNFTYYTPAEPRDIRGSITDDDVLVMFWLYEGRWRVEEATY
jgi:hypothetical protein